VVIAAGDVIPLSQASADLSGIADRPEAGFEKIVTKNGEQYVAIVDAQRLDYAHKLQRACISLLLAEEAGRGLDDIAAGNVKDARRTLSAIRRRRVP